ncbi:MAG: NAD(P)-dependent dehydrogenase (short-subunit alcohol dehydrogenase family) [Cellvibrionaceae bacterium]|jgi:NAD(P)-dependent dehydrogenase (short-subunit alcohol dehydrogenase family)
MQISGSTFLVTGGASGLGSGAVRRFAGMGANVVIMDVNEEDGNALAAELGENVVFNKTDVTNEAHVQAGVDLAMESFGAIHGVVNCAGIAIGERVLGRQGPHRLESFSRVITINLIGSFNVLRLAAVEMAKNEPNAGGERGMIINTASVAAYDGQIGQAAYAASKGGLVSMTLPIARELARSGIRCNTIAPGIFGTPMLGGMSEEIQQALAAAVPFPQRLGTPEDYANLAQHIVENDMLNGETIRLDGAIRLAPK